MGRRQKIAETIQHVNIFPVIVTIKKGLLDVIVKRAGFLSPGKNYLFS
jgi:hypothetical protein